MADGVPVVVRLGISAFSYLNLEVPLDPFAYLIPVFLWLTAPSTSSGHRHAGGCLGSDLVFHLLTYGVPVVRCTQARNCLIPLSFVSYPLPGTTSSIQ